VHAVPVGQHATPGVPQLQVPETQVPPLGHEVPLQHASSGAPHVQTLLELHVRFEPQLPAQQGCPADNPQVTQLPLTHSLPGLHVPHDALPPLELELPPPEEELPPPLLEDPLLEVVPLLEDPLLEVVPLLEDPLLEVVPLLDDPLLEVVPLLELPPLEPELPLLESAPLDELEAPDDPLPPPVELAPLPEPPLLEAPLLPELLLLAPEEPLLDDSRLPSTPPSAPPPMLPVVLPPPQAGAPTAANTAMAAPKVRERRTRV